MNKPIIIDGVDVDKCSLFRNGKCIKRKIEVNDKDGFHFDYEKCNSFCDYGAYFRQEQLQQLKNTLKHVEKGRKIKAEKLKKVEEIVIHCIQGGYTDDFIQQIFDLCQENEDI